MPNSNSNRLTRGIEITANVAIIVIAVAIVVVFAKNHLTSAHSAVPLPEITAGSRLEAQSVNWSTHPKNLVFVLSTTCHFCKESTGFYKKLIRQSQDEHVPTIAFFPQSPEEAQAYLKAQGVPIDEVRQAKLQSLKVSGTPTLLLVDGSGVVQDVWVGKLSSGKEEEVLVKLGSGATQQR